MEKIQTIIIGGGQAGLSTSYFLCQMGHEHLVLERASRAGSVWRNDRWDSFTLLTPNWSIKLPGMSYSGNNPDGFMSRGELVSYFEKYIENFDLPIQYNTAVTEVTQLEDGEGYLVKTNDKTFQSKNVYRRHRSIQTAKTLNSVRTSLKQVVQIHSVNTAIPAAACWRSSHCQLGAIGPRSLRSCIRAGVGVFV
jgi:putative flavoprotein involved in K+ transport